MYYIKNYGLNEYNWKRKKWGYIKQRLKQITKKKKKNSNDGQAN